MQIESACMQEEKGKSTNIEIGQMRGQEGERERAGEQPSLSFHPGP